MQVHGFTNASQLAYVGVVYLRAKDSDKDMNITLVMAKTRVAPIKRLTIPCFELCGATFLASMLH